MEEEWDAEQSVRSLFNATHLLVEEKRNFNFASRNLFKVAERFYDKAIDAKYQTQLSLDQQSEFRLTVRNLADWVHQKSIEQCFSYEVQGLLQISLIQVLRYALAKTYPQTYDDFWCINAYKLALKTGALCFDSGDIPKTCWCLKEAIFYPQHRMTFGFQLVEFRGSLILTNSIWLILKMLCILKSASTQIESLVESIEHLKEVVISDQQFQSITRFIVNQSLTAYESEQFFLTIFFLKQACYFGSYLARSTHRNALLSRTTELLVATLFEMDVESNSDQIKKILSSGIESSLGIHYLKLRTALHWNAKPPIIVNATIKLLQKLNISFFENSFKFRTHALKIFKILENYSYLHALEKILQEIPWQEHCDKNAHNSSSQWSNNCWVLAEVALRCYTVSKFNDKSIQVLQFLAKNPITSPARLNSESVRSIFWLAESTAIGLQSKEDSYDWYKLLLKIAKNVGSTDYLEPNLTQNAIRCFISVKSERSLMWAHSLIEQWNTFLVPNLQPVSYMFLVAILRGDKVKATELGRELEMAYKEGNFGSRNECRDEVFTTLEHCIMASLQVLGFEDVTLLCLSCLMFEVKRQSSSSSTLLTQAIKFHLGLLFLRSHEQSPVALKCIDNLLTMLISCYLNARNNSGLSSNQPGPTDFSLWLGNLTWFLAQRISWLLPFQRHQLFRLSYRSFQLIHEAETSTRERIDDAIILSVAAGLNSIGEANVHYTNILQRCLKSIADYSGHSPDKTLLLRQYEFLVLSELGSVKGLSQFIQRYASDPLYDHNFFENLSILASRAYRQYLPHIIPVAEHRNLSVNSRERRPHRLQLKLNYISIKCLKIAINKLVQNQSFCSALNFQQIAKNWQMIFQVSTEESILFQAKQVELFNLFREYIDFIQGIPDRNEDLGVIHSFNFWWNIVMDLKISHASQHLTKWIQLIEYFASVSTELQKLFRILKREYLSLRLP